MNIRMYTRKDQPNKEGLVEIIFMVGTNKISTREFCLPTAWQQKSQQVSGKYNGSAQINSKLRKHYATLDQIIKSSDSLDSFSINNVRRLFNIYLDAPDRFTIDHADINVVDNFSVLVEKIIDTYRNEWSEGHKKKFRTVRKKITDFDKDFKIEKLSLSWWQEYVDYCFDTLENSHNTIQTDFKIMGQLAGIVSEMGYKYNKDFLKASMTYIEPRIEPLTWSEVKIIAKEDLSFDTYQKLEDSRYVWVLGAYLGQRWKDIQRISKLNFTKKKVELSTGKTKEIWYYSNRMQKTKKLIEIPLLDEAVRWLEKRNFEIPKLTQQVVNRDIKTIAKKSTKFNDLVVVQKIVKGDVTETLEHRWKRIHIHTGRHSYAIELCKRSLGKPYAEKFVSEMLGHASPATTWKYMNFISSQKEKMFLEIIGK